jgi:hypothetical protein
MRFFLDCEFIASGTNLDLLSVAVVSERGHEYYAENKRCDLSRANEWVRNNVFPHLQRNTGELDGFNVKSPELIALDLVDFVARLCGENDEPEFWGWCCGFDYAALCLLFSMDHWPSGWPYYFRDVQQIADEHGFVFPEQPKSGEHNAMIDARWVKRLYEYAREVAP